MRIMTKIVKGLVFVAVGVIVFGFVTKELWNWLVPSIFGLRAITFWQAVGLVLLGKILFGGFHKHGHGGGNWNRKREWKRRMKARWEAMTPEEREKFRAGMHFGGTTVNFGCRVGKHERPVSEAAR